ncbi:MAG: MarR family transcriptional regulator [Balneolaceae bacterium]|nr:MarR family transcriptional regulator [Balneolaceae bacterium]
MSNREKLINDINSAGRYFSMATILFHESVAEKAGLSGADHKYLDLLVQEGPMTAGKLAELSGLTTGAVTGIIDRLEKKSLVNRKSDPHDRRKVLVVADLDNTMKLLGPVFKVLQSDLEIFYDNYSDEQLKTIHEYLSKTIEFLKKKTDHLKENDV